MHIILFFLLGIDEMAGERENKIDIWLVEHKETENEIRKGLAGSELAMKKTVLV